MSEANTEVNELLSELNAQDELSEDDVFLMQLENNYADSLERVTLAPPISVPVKEVTKEVSKVTAKLDLNDPKFNIGNVVKSVIEKPKVKQAPEGQINIEMIEDFIASQISADDFQVKKLSNSNCDLVISILRKHSNFKVKNGRNNVHIEEMFTKTEYRFNWLTSSKKLKYKVQNFSGMRTGYSNLHWVAQYKHSHLSNSSNNSFSGFCLGSGALGLKYYIYKTMTVSDFWNDLGLNIALESDYLEWESVDGVPYRYMRDIPDQFSSNGGNSSQSSANDLLSGRTLETFTYPNSYRDALNDVVSDSYEKSILSFTYLGLNIRDFFEIKFEKFGISIDANPHQELMPLNVFLQRDPRLGNSDFIELNKIAYLYVPSIRTYSKLNTGIILYRNCLSRIGEIEFELNEINNNKSDPDKGEENSSNLTELDISRETFKGKKIIIYQHGEEHSDGRNIEDSLKNEKMRLNQLIEILLNSKLRICQGYTHALKDRILSNYNNLIIKNKI